MPLDTQVSQTKEGTMEMELGSLPGAHARVEALRHTLGTWNPKNREMEHHFQTARTAWVSGGEFSNLHFEDME